MKQVILICIVALFSIPLNTQAQFAVVDAQNAWLNNSQIVKQLEQLEKMTRQINTMKDQLSFTKRQYERQIENLKRLPDGEFNSVDDLNRNLKNVNNAAQNMAYMRNYIKDQYTDLYDAGKRIDAIINDPEKYEQYREERARHLDEEANQVIASSEENLKRPWKDYVFLDKTQAEMNKSKLTPMEMQQIQAKVNAMSAQQLIEMKRIIAQHASFAARKYKQEQGEKNDQRAKIDKFNEQFNKDFKAWEENIPENERTLIPNWEDNGGN